MSDPHMLIWGRDNISMPKKSIINHSLFLDLKLSAATESSRMQQRLTTIAVLVLLFQAILVRTKTFKVDCGSKIDLSELGEGDSYQITSHKAFGKKDYEDKDKCTVKVQVIILSLKSWSNIEICHWASCTHILLLLLFKVVRT